MTRRSSSDRHLVHFVAGAFVLVLGMALPLDAQDDRSAGLFTEAAQLPLVAQSLSVEVASGEALLELEQVFANEGPHLAQADFRLHLPDGASVLGFGFWTGAAFHAATLKERDEAVRSHAEAATEHRPTALLVRKEGTIRSFSVFPVEAGALQRVRTTIRLPVVTEAGRSTVRLPLDAFLGHARLESTVLVHLRSDEAIERVGVRGGRFEVLSRGRRAARLFATTEESVDLWWEEAGPPLSVVADAVDLGDGTFGLGLRLVARALEGADHPSERVVVLDASTSLLRRRRAVRDLLERVEQLGDTRVLAVGARVEALPADSSAAMRLLVEGDFGFDVAWEELTSVAWSEGCGSSQMRCLIVTDPQVLGLPGPADRPEELEVLFLADAEEKAHYGEILEAEARVVDPDTDPRTALRSRLDEALRPVMRLRDLEQVGGGPRMLTPGPWRVAEGGVLRLVGLAPTPAPIRVRLEEPDGRERQVEVVVVELPVESPGGRSLRRAVFAEQLDVWVREYRKSRDPALKQRIVDTSISEGLPTELTALQVDVPAGRLPRTGTPGPILRALGLVLLLGGLLLGKGAGRDRPGWARGSRWPRLFGS